MKGADVVMAGIVQYNDWLEEEVWGCLSYAPRVSHASAFFLSGHPRTKLVSVAEWTQPLKHLRAGRSLCLAIHWVSLPPNIYAVARRSGGEFGISPVNKMDFAQNWLPLKITGFVLGLILCLDLF